jgi:PBSX family phage terminase large subunit
MPISKKQKQILAFPHTKYDALIADGAIRSGKTAFMIIAFIDAAMRDFSGQRFGICGKTVDSTIKNIIVPYLGLTWKDHKGYTVKWKKSDKTLIVTRGETENIFEIFGGKDESSFALIQGRTLAGVLFDEVALQPRSFVEQALARCSVAGSKFWFNCNPESPDHWFFKEWICDLKKHNALRLRFQLEDNPSLTKEIIARYKTINTGVFYQRYILGEWVRAEGIIYREFCDNERDFYITAEEVPTDSLGYICVGQDFGGNRSKHTFCATAISRDYKTLYVLASEEHDANCKSVAFVIDALTAFCEMIERRYGEIDYIFADSAEQTLINSERQNTRWTIRNSVKNEIIERIRATDLMLAGRRIKIVEAENKSLINALRCAVWDEKAPTDTRLDKPGETNIDPLDAFEYSWELWIRRLTSIR